MFFRKVLRKVFKFRYQKCLNFDTKAKSFHGMIFISFCQKAGTKLHLINSGLAYIYIVHSFVVGGDTCGQSKPRGWGLLTMQGCSFQVCMHEEQHCMVHSHTYVYVYIHGQYMNIYIYIYVYLHFVAHRIVYSIRVQCFQLNVAKLAS